MRVLLAGWHDRDPETDAAEAWLAGHGFVSRRSDARAVSSDDLNWADVTWCHGTAVWTDPPSDALRRRISTVGGALLTLAACRLIADCQLEPLRPSESRGTWSDDADPLWDASFRDWPDYPHIRGLQGWAAGLHPLFEGFQRGTFSRHFTEGDEFTECGYLWPAWPQGATSRVVAVERAYVQLHSARAVAWEYAIGGRRILCIGAHVALSGADPRLRAQRDRLLGNALALVARPGPPAPTEAAWPTRPASKAFSIRSPGQVAHGPPPTGDGAADDAPFTIAGRRSLVTGTERDGIRDIWIHPLCIVSGGMRMTIDGSPLDADRVQVSPSEVRRVLKHGSRTATQRIVPALNDAAVLVTFESAERIGQAELQFRLPLRLEWPFDAEALWPLSVERSIEGTRHQIAIIGCDRTHSALITIDGAESVEVDASDAVPALSIRSGRGANLAILIAAGNGGVEVLRSAVGSSAPVGQDQASERDRHFAALRQRTIRSRTPNEMLDAGLHWAIHRLDLFLARTPDGATGIMAGYASSGQGWNVSRPGYAWFFGRDACWCADAMLAAGMFDEVRRIIHHLASTRDITGKVIHELTTSGVAHYDAADSTPLFLRLVASYVDWTNDLEFIREIWEAVRDALNFVESTDRDHDGLPDNTDVGHGWIESGPLGGGAVTSYVAAIWIDAVGRLARIARLLDEPSAVAVCGGLLLHARHAFETRLRDPATHRVRLQLQQDGTPQDDVTALSAVPIALGVDRDPSADDVLKLLTSKDYTAPWGVRLISRTDTRYNPRGYHSGAVWPLFTGWTALACFVRGSPQDGQHLLEANALLWTQRAKGAFDEVLDGDTGGAAGVCPDQAWSAAMAITPLVQGVWGVQPDAPGRAIRFGLQLPEEWTNAALEGIRIGQASIDIRVQREASSLTTIQHVAFLAHDAPGSLDTVIIEVLARDGENVELQSRGELLVAVSRECRVGWNWLGVALAVGTGEGHLSIRRSLRP